MSPAAVLLMIGIAFCVSAVFLFFGDALAARWDSRSGRRRRELVYIRELELAVCESSRLAKLYGALVPQWVRR